MSDAKLLLQELQNEFSQFGRICFDGKIGQEYMPFVEYWCIVGKNYCGNVPKPENINTKLLEDFYKELSDIGYCSFNGKIGQEYASFVDYWCNFASRNVLQPYPNKQAV